MDLEFVKELSTLIVKINCELDHHSSDSLRRKVDGEIQRYMPQNLVFDFDGVRFMDSSGIGMIMGRYKNIKRYDGKAVMANVRPEIKRIFEMSGITKIIPQYANLAKALEGIQGGKKDAI
ncbi:MAG: anti-sigma F factor antagonist [Ignavibacteriales bacterium]